MLGREFEAKDPRDRIYAVLGMAEESIAGSDANKAPVDLWSHSPYLSIVVDYTESISDVYDG